MSTKSGTNAPPRKKPRRDRSPKGNCSASFRDIMNVDKNSRSVNMNKNRIGGRYIKYVYKVPTPSSKTKNFSEKDISDLREKLAQGYKNITLPNVSWMDNGKLDINSYYVPLQLESNNKKISIDEIFDGICDTVSGQNLRSAETPCNASTSSTSHVLQESRIIRENGVEPKRILIEAPPGYGKTTLAHKLIYDWANGEDYVKRFKFAFLIILQNVSQDISKEVVHIASDCGFGKKEIIEDLIGKFANQTLIVLDGLEELAGSKDNVLKVLYKKQFQTTTVIATCRTGSFVLTPQEKNLFNRGISKACPLFEKTVNIIGFSEISKRTLLENLVEDKAKIDYLAEKMNPVKKLFECPLFVTLIAFIVDENPEIHIETTTDLCKYLVDHVIRRNLSKYNDNFPTNFTLFGTCNSSKEHKDIFCYYGKLSAKCFDNDGLQFVCDDQTDEIYNMGLLTKYGLKTKFSCKFFYKGVHDTILAFAAAFSLWTEYKSNRRRFKNEMTHQIHKLFSGSGEFSMAFPFLCEFFGEDVLNLFISVGHHAAVLSTSTCDAWYILPEYNTVMLSHTVSFFPTLKYFRSEMFFKNVQDLKKQFPFKKFKFLTFIDGDNRRLPQNKHWFISQLTKP